MNKLKQKAISDYTIWLDKLYKGYVTDYTHVLDLICYISNCIDFNNNYIYQYLLNN